tara:strand:- start:262 stop:987 length:726 start_codon:yes stop_codon:yes gene_type:complete
MASVNEVYTFHLIPKLLFPLKGTNIHLIEKLHRLMRLKEINISDDCYIGSKFDDSNEYARKRNQLGFSPGFDFKMSRIDNVLTIIYNSDKKNTLVCIEEFVNNFTIYQEKLYKDFLQKLFVAKELQINTYNFVDYYGQKYDLMSYWEEYQINKDLDSEVYSELIDKGADKNLIKMFFVFVKESFDIKKNSKNSFFEKIDGKLINEITTKSLNPKKFLVLIIINFISIMVSFSYVLIKEYKL